MTLSQIQYELDRLRNKICCNTNSIVTGSNTQSGDGSTFTYTITHEVTNVDNNTFFIIQPTSAGAASPLYSEISSTQITIVYDSGAAPALGTDNLTWNWLIKK